MALIAKTDPPLQVSETGTARIHARPYKAAMVENGAEIFVWTSETSGGHGLAATGLVVSSAIETFPNKTGSGSHKELVLEVQVRDAAPSRALTLEELATHRDGADTPPQAAISDVLYKHSLNKITSIESDVADFVRSHFEGS